MKNKFDSELVKTSVFKNREEKASSPALSQSTPRRAASGKKYTKMLNSMSEEPTYGVNVQIPLSYYRRMRDYKDLHKEESFQSIVYEAIIQWVEKNA